MRIIYSKKSTYKHSFTLLELSIVIIVMSIILSTILVSRLLIDRAKTNKVQQDYVDIGTIINIFQNTFSCLPGDCGEIYLPQNIIDRTPSNCFNLTTTTTMGNASSPGNSSAIPISPPIIIFGNETISSNAKRTCAFYEMQALEPQAFGGLVTKNSLFKINRAMAIGTGGALSMNNQNLQNAIARNTAVSTPPPNTAAISALQSAQDILKYNASNGLLNNTLNTANNSLTASGLQPLAGMPNIIPSDPNSPLDFLDYTWVSNSILAYSNTQCASTDCSSAYQTAAVISSVPFSAINVMASTTCGCVFYCDPLSSYCGYRSTDRGCSNCAGTGSSSSGYISHTDPFRVSAEKKFIKSITNAARYTPTVAQYQAAVTANNALNGLSTLPSSSLSSAVASANSQFTTYSSLLSGCVQTSLNGFCATQINSLSSAPAPVSVLPNNISLSAGGATQPFVPSFQSTTMWELRTAGSMPAPGFYPYELNDSVGMSSFQGKYILIARNSSINDINSITDDMSGFSATMSAKIDIKYDDGIPYTGNIIAGKNISQMPSNKIGCTTSTTISMNSPVTSPSDSYISNNSLSQGCVLAWVLVH